MSLPPNLDWNAFLQGTFGITPYAYETSILDAIFKQKARRVTVRAATRAGKSYTMAMAAVTAAAFQDNMTVGIIAPTYPKTRKIMDHVADLLASNPSFDALVMLDVEGMTRLERLRKEVSKKRITFTNGSSIHSLSADVDSHGFGVMGFAYKLIIVDETDEIPDEAYTKIYRMLAESPDAALVEIGNPWFLQHFYRNHHDPAWHKIRVPWQECVAAGRMTQEDINDQRRNMTDLEFRVLFDAEFPEELVQAVFSSEAIHRMIEPIMHAKQARVLIGVDVARSGRDLTAMSVLGLQEGHAAFLEGKTMDTRDVMTVVGAVRETADHYQLAHCKTEIIVDTVGLGAGVKDRLTELGYDAHEFIAGEKARDERYYNLKTEVAFRAAEAAKAGLIQNLPPASKYVLQLRAWTYEVRSDRQLRILDPESKSPDEADSLLMALSRFVYHDDARVTGKDAAWRPKQSRPRDIIRGHRQP